MLFASKESGGVTPIEFSSRRLTMRSAHEAHLVIAERSASAKSATIVPIPIPSRRPAVDNLPAVPAATTSSVPRRLLFVGAMLVSISVHAAAIFGIWGSNNDIEQFGTIANESDVISLSTVQTLVLDSIQTDSSDAASAASSASQAGSVQSVESTPQELSEVQDQPVSDEPPPKPVKVADVTPAAVAPTDEPLPVVHGGGEPDALSEIKADKIAAKAVEEMPAEIETKEDEPEKTKQDQKKDKQRQTEQKQSHAQAAGGATSRSSVARSTSNGRVTASRGNVLSYMASLQARIARHKIPVFGIHGVALVVFALDANGAIKFARLDKSSGNERLDQAALTSIRRAAPFLPPPAELPPTQTYSIPFYAK
jgi:protein TonB